MMYMNINDANTREQIIFGRDYNPETYRYGGMIRFGYLTANDAHKLIDLGLMDPEDCQNSSPTAKEFLDFVDTFGEDWYLHGYVISPERDDYRVTIEGIGCERPLEDDEKTEFIKMNRWADELEFENGAYCWYD